MVRRISSLQTASGHRRNRNVSHRYQLVFIFVILSFFSIQSHAQIALGLYEGLMGNSGAALSDPTAASIYNPSLLSRKKKDSYSLSGNSFGTFSTKSEQSSLTSLNLNPGYISTVLVGTTLVHEFFIANNAPASNSKIIANFGDANSFGKSDFNQTATRFIFGYSMAFRSIPFALSYFGQYNQSETNGFTELTSLISNFRATSTTKGELKYLGVGISVSGHTETVSGYTLGYQVRTRQLIVYKKDLATTTSFIHGGTTPTDYSQQVSTSENQSTVSNGSSVVIGHGFTSGDHEFITDSQLNETSDLNYSFKMTQTFGYRMNSKSGTQLLAGFAHQLGPEVKYVGQSAYYSVGMSWLKNSLRSTFGAYALTSRISQDVFAAGLTFGSEFNY